MAIGSFKLPNTAAAAPVDPDAWVRPSDWLAMPTIGTQEFVGLLAITDDESNHIAILCAGAYTVDWGDGVTENVADNVKAQHSYTYSAISGTLSTRGYKQVLVRVTPQAGQNLTKIDLNQQNSILAKVHTVSWLDLSINGANITTLTLSAISPLVRLSMCERVVIGLTGTITSFAYLFNEFRQLQDVFISTSSAVTNFSGMFQSCNSLKNIPLINTSSGTNFGSMFALCYSLKTIPLINTSLGTAFDSMFYGCGSLQTIPLINTSLGTSFAFMFQSCNYLQTIPLINTAAGTSFTYMFYGCNSLQTIPLINTAAGTNFSFMFDGCSSLQSLPLINTGLGTNFSTMLRNCYALQQLPNLNTALGTSFTLMVSGSTSLAKGAFQGTRYAISYSGMCLSQSAIVDIFNGLGTAVGTPTINVSSNPGRAALTAAEILIATNKGFTVV